MKHSLTLGLALSTVVLVSIALARPEPITQRGGEGEGGLAGHMSDLGRSLEKLEEQLEDESKMAEALTEVCRLQKVVIDAKNETPSTIASIESEKKQKKAALKYRATMQDLLRGFLDLETALANGDTKKAKKALRTFDKLQSAGHSEFKPKDW